MGQAREREREMADAGLLGCEAQRAKLNGPAAKKRKVGEGEMKLGLLLRWAERRNQGGPKGKEEREKRVLGFSFLFQNLFLFKPFSNLNIFKKIKTFQIILKLLKLHTNKQKPRNSKYDAQVLVASKIIQK
jgi:hypothetical protein